ncbi:MAG: gliding motility-associated ABC transporter ATP-binding subunit GldA [Schleiferiaceae bacterium]
MSISVSSITKTYGTQRALDNVSFSVGKGEIVGFLGPNGAGKSTMMKILTGYIPATDGQASVCDLSTDEDSLSIRSKIGYLPEHNPQYLEMYVREYLAFVAGVYGKGKDQISHLIEKTGLTPEANKKIGQLSKGYRQRVGLAAAMIHDPEVLILDEPTTGLDPNQLVEIRGLIKELGKSKTVLLSTHIMQEVEQLCDRVIIINKGKIVADQPTTELTHLKGGKAYRVEFSSKISKTVLKKLPEVREIRAISDTEFIAIEKSGDLRKALFDLAVSQGNQLLAIQEEHTSLEDVFHQLTQ